MDTQSYTHRPYSAHGAFRGASKLDDNFLHIDKTGGTTLGFPLRHLYGLRTSLHVGRPPRAYLQLSPAEKRSIRLIKGHHDFGLHEHAPVPCTYITILRDPIRRMASMHRMMKKEWPGYDVAEMSLAAFVRFDHPASRPNAQTLQVAGASPQDAATDPDGVLERAKAHIDEHFAVAGITERFDETIDVDEAETGLAAPSVLRDLSCGEENGLGGPVSLPARVDATRTFAP